MTHLPDAWPILHAAGIELTQHDQAWRGWLWRIEGVLDWDGPYDTPGEALSVALRSLINRARARQAEENAAIAGPDEDFAAYQRITKRAGMMITFTRQPVAAPVLTDDELSDVIMRAFDTSHE